MTAPETSTRGPFDYLWFTLVIEGEPVPMLSVLDLGARTDARKIGALTLTVRREAGGFALHTRWTPAPDLALPRFDAQHHIESEAQRAPDELGIVNAAYRTVHTLVRAAGHAQEFSQLHCAVVDVPAKEGPRRTLIAAPSGTGKTTMCLALAERGVDVISDEGALIDGDVCWGLPRRMHVKASGAQFIPERAHSDLVRLATSDPLFAIDPARLSMSPHRAAHAARPIDRVIVLAERSGELRIEPAEPGATIDLLLGEGAMYVDNGDRAVSTQRRLIRALSRVLSSTPVWRMRGFEGTAGADLLIATVAGDRAGAAARADELGMLHEAAR